MKKLYIAFVGMACLCLACSRDDRALLDGEGNAFRLRAQVNDEVQISSAGRCSWKARLRPREELKKNCRVRIYKGEKLIYKHAGVGCYLARTRTVFVERCVSRAHHFG